MGAYPQDLLQLESLHIALVDIGAGPFLSNHGDGSKVSLGG